eukprot:365897_1
MAAEESEAKQPEIVNPSAAPSVDDEADGSSSARENGKKGAKIRMEIREISHSNEALAYIEERARARYLEDVPEFEPSDEAAIHSAEEKSSEIDAHSEVTEENEQLSDEDSELIEFDNHVGQLGINRIHDDGRAVNVGQGAIPPAVGQHHQRQPMSGTYEVSSVELQQRLKQSASSSGENSRNAVNIGQGAIPPAVGQTDPAPYIPSEDSAEACAALRAQLAEARQKSADDENYIETLKRGLGNDAVPKKTRRPKKRKSTVLERSRTKTSSKRKKKRKILDKISQTIAKSSRPVVSRRGRLSKPKSRMDFITDLLDSELSAGLTN